MQEKYKIQNPPKNEKKKIVREKYPFVCGKTMYRMK